MARAAIVAPKAGSSLAIRCANRPIWTNRPSAKAADSVRKRRLAEAARDAAAAAAAFDARAGGARRRKRQASGQTTATVASATSEPASDKPPSAINAVHSGVNSRPPMLAPLKAMLIAFGRSRSNHGATMALSAAPLIAAQPAPLSSSAGTSCQVCCAFVQAMAPAAASTAPPMVTRRDAEAAIGVGQAVIRAALTRYAR